MLPIYATNLEKSSTRFELTIFLHGYLERFAGNSAPLSKNEEVDVKHEHDQRCKQRTGFSTCKSSPHFVEIFMIHQQPKIRMRNSQVVLEVLEVFQGSVIHGG